MAIHINEIIFRATVQKEKDGKAGSGSGGKINNKEKQMIIEESVEQVLKIIKMKMER